MDLNFYFITPGIFAQSSSSKKTSFRDSLLVSVSAPTGDMSATIKVSEAFGWRGQTGKIQDNAILHRWGITSILARMFSLAGRHSHPAWPASGNLRSAEPYCVLEPFSIEMNSTAHLLSSLGELWGSYMVPLCLPTKRSRRFSFVSTISLAPTGLSTSAILAELLTDIVEGTAKRFDPYDAKVHESISFLIYGDCSRTTWCRLRSWMWWSILSKHIAPIAHLDPEQTRRV